MKLNTGLTAFTLISSFCAGSGAGDSVKKVHLRGKATIISDYANPTNPHNSAASANVDEHCVCIYCDCGAFPLHHEHESPTLLNLAEN